MISLSGCCSAGRSLVEPAPGCPPRPPVSSAGTSGAVFAVAALPASLSLAAQFSCRLWFSLRCRLTAWLRVFSSWASSCPASRSMAAVSSGASMPSCQRGPERCQEQTGPRAAAPPQPAGVSHSLPPLTTPAPARRTADVTPPGALCRSQRSPEAPARKAADATGDFHHVVEWSPGGSLAQRGADPGATTGCPRSARRAGSRSARRRQ